MQQQARPIIAALATAATIVTADGAFASDPRKLGLAIANLETDFFIQIKQSAEEAARETGTAVVILDAKGDGAAQASQVQDLIDQRSVQALIYIPAGAQASAVPVKAAKAAGIPVVTVDRNPIDQPGDTFIGTNQVSAARVLGRYACKLTGGRGDLAVLIGPPHTTHEDDRDTGFKEAMKDCPGIDEVDRAWTEWTTNDGFTNAQRMVARDPDIALIFGHSDALALGAAQAVREAYLGHKVYVVGFDGDDAGLQAVDAGMLDATMTQPTRLMGRLAVQSALDLAAGRMVPAEQLQEAVLTTKDNVGHLIADHP